MFVATLNTFSNMPTFEKRLPKLIENVSKNSYDILTLLEVGVETDFVSQVCEASGMTIAVSDLDKVREDPSGKFGNVILVSPFWNVVSNDITLLPGSTEPCEQASRLSTAILEHEETKVSVSTTHLAWGGTNEHIRCAQVEAIDSLLSFDLGYSATILTGDLNTPPDSASIRFLMGLQPSRDGTRGTFWTDCWASLNPDNEGHTVCAANPVTSETAQYVGTIKPELVPNRRVDYIMLRGWRTGKPFGPLSTELFGVNPPLSDHYGVRTRLDSFDPITNKLYSGKPKEDATVPEK